MEVIIGVVCFFMGVITALIISVALLYHIAKVSAEEDGCSGGYDYDFTSKRKNTEGCNGYNMSNCCGARITMTDICSACGEHCSNWCYDCDDICEDYTEM